MTKHTWFKSEDEYMEDEENRLLKNYKNHNQKKELLSVQDELIQKLAEVRQVNLEIEEANHSDIIDKCKALRMEIDSVIKRISE